MADKNCANCIHMTIERHEDYMGQQCWYLGKCEYGNENKNDCPAFEQGEPKKKDCRVKGDW